MARDILKSRNNTLKNIAEKQMTGDAPRMIDLKNLVEHKDNEMLFGMDGIAHMKHGIETNGFKGAIEVWDLKDGTFMIYSGHRRYRAVKELGYDKIKCFVYPYPEDETVRRRELLGANLFGRNSINAEDPIHTARQIAYHRQTIQMERDNGTYKGDSDTRKELSREFGTSDAQIYRYESLLKLAPDVQKAVEQREIQFAQASSMAVLDEDKQIIVKDAIVKFKETEGEGNVTRNKVQQIVDYVKKSDDAPVTADEVVTAMVEKTKVPEQQVTEDEEKPLQGQIKIVDEDMNVAVESAINPPVEENEVINDEDDNSEVTNDEELSPEEAEKEQKDFVKKFQSGYDKMEEILTEYFDYNEVNKRVVVERLNRLDKLIANEINRLSL